MVDIINSGEKDIYENILKHTPHIFFNYLFLLPLGLFVQTKIEIGPYILEKESTLQKVSNRWMPDNKSEMLTWTFSSGKLKWEKGHTK